MVIQFSEDISENTHLKQTHMGLSRSHVYQELINYLTVHRLTPCIFFCFSRKKCEQQARSVSQSLCDNDEISQIKSIMKEPSNNEPIICSKIKLELYIEYSVALSKRLNFSFLQNSRITIFCICCVTLSPIKVLLKLYPLTFFILFLVNYI